MARSIKDVLFLLGKGFPMRAVTEHIFVIPRFFTNIYIIDTGSGLALVDTHFSPAVIATLEKELPSHDFQLSQITHILITHAHFDHVGGLAALQNRINARTIAHRRDAPIIRGEQPSIAARREELKGVDWVISHFLAGNATPARIDAELKEGDEVLPGVQVVELPGHTYGQIGFWWQDKRVLIGGDVMMNLPWGLSVPTRAASPDWAAVKQSIRKVADMSVDVLCVGHGNPIIGGASAKVQALSQKIGT
jgi:glyoxylase-like metal-dependent hydrolase (beta-lactamase superfamily II)